jgi:hypothetical protein
MKSIARIVAPLSLAATIVPPLLFLLKVMPIEPMKITMLIAAIAWFATAPFWLKGAEE